MRSVSNGKRCAAVGRARAAERTSRLLAVITFIVLAALFMLVVTPGRVLSQGVSLVRVNVAVVAKGLRMSKLIGTNVVNDKNEPIGDLEDVVVTADRSLFAVLEVGGFLGIGGRLVALPFESLKISEEGRKIVLPGASKEELRKLAEFKFRS
jgi:hypothetical protein